MSAKRLMRRTEKLGNVTEDFGESLPLDQHIETTRTFTLSEMNQLLIQHVVNTLPPFKGSWAGHVRLSTIRSNEGATVAATVSVWKEGIAK